MWTTAGSLSTPRSYFAHEVVNGKIFAIGGLESGRGDTNTRDFCDPQTNCWSSCRPNDIPDVEDSLVLDEKIYVRCCSSDILSHTTAIAYDPFNRRWKHADADLFCSCNWWGICMCLMKLLGVTLTVWQKDCREWKTVRTLSSLLMRPPCRLVAVGKKMFVIGKGLSIVMMDVRDICYVDCVLVSSSVPGLNSVKEVISCKSLAI